VSHAFDAIALEGTDRAFQRQAFLETGIGNEQIIDFAEPQFAFVDELNGVTDENLVPVPLDRLQLTPVTGLELRHLFSPC
jgi:hypothetical protein